MAKVSGIQNVMNAGELSPLLDARSDLSKYSNGLALCENFIPFVQGSVQRRPGSHFVAEVKTSSKSTRILPFQFSTAQAYIIEMGDQYLRFFKDNGQIESGGSPYEIASPYLEADLFEVKIAQSADILYLTHPSYAPRKLSRTSDTSWTLTEIDFQDGPYLPTNTTATTLTPSGTTGSITITASAVTGINNDTGFQTSDVGRLIRIKDSASDWTWLEITAYTSTTVVTATVRGADFATAAAYADWRLGVWSDTTGYPAAVTFFQDRLYLAGGVDYPQRLDGSNTGNYETFSPSDPDGTVPGDRSPAFTLNANQVNVIRWLDDDEKGMLIGTVGGEWLVRASSQGEVVTPSNIRAAQSSNYGSADVQPVRAGNATLFIQRAGRKMREHAYVFEADGFRSPDMTLLSEHITKSGITDTSYQQEPQSLIWSTRTDGVLLGFTYERDQEVLGWHRHLIGGTDTAVESVAVIPAPTEDRDELWMVVSRTIDGGTKRYVEYLGKLWEDGDAIEDAFFVDSGLTYDSTPTSSISGLDHLEGETVSILADGATHPNKTVSAGAVTLEREASVVHAGLAYNSNLQTVKPDLGSQDGTAQGKLKRVHRIVLRFWQSVGGKFGATANDLEILEFRSGSDSMDTAVPPFTGDKELIPNTDYGRDGQVYFRQDQPLPSNILAVMLRLATADP